jgi:hypothetical protein
MPNLSVLDEPRTFPPKMFYLIIWMVTLAFAVYGIIATPYGGALAIWSTIGAIAIWQLWTLRWVQVDNEGIRIRNIARRGRELHWEQITVFREENITFNRRVYSIIDLSNEGLEGVTRPTRIRLTSDQTGFDTLQKIVHEAVPDTSK